MLSWNYFRPITLVLAPILLVPLCIHLDVTHLFLSSFIFRFSRFTGVRPARKKIDPSTGPWPWFACSRQPHCVQNLTSRSENIPFTDFSPYDFQLICFRLLQSFRKQNISIRNSYCSTAPVRRKFYQSNNHLLRRVVVRCMVRVS